jgi:chromosome segregation ATPase
MWFRYGDLVLVLLGENKSQKDVMNAISRMNIQVDNLCQFLPQDKVAEFAQVSYIDHWHMTG